MARICRTPGRGPRLVRTAAEIFGKNVDDVASDYHVFVTTGQLPNSSRREEIDHWRRFDANVRVHSRALQLFKKADTNGWGRQSYEFPPDPKSLSGSSR